ncbi:MAG: FGGY-family carbohydrate kinase [Beutenbergiaceae bacterium]
MLGLGFDIGTTTSKVALIAVDGPAVSEVSSASAPTPATAEELTDMTAALSRRVMGQRRARVDAVGVASMAESGVPVDRHGRALTPILRWDEGLGRQDAELLADLRADLFAATGVRLSAKTPLATWAWLRRTHGSTWAQMRRWLNIADLVVRDLTGASVTDHTLAGRTGGYRLPPRHGSPASTFDQQLLELVGLAPHRLPAVADPRQCAAAVTSAAAGRYLLTGGTPVAVAGHDHQVAAWAAGVRRPGQCADSLGTAEAVLSLVSERPPPASVAAAGMSLTRTPAGIHDAVVGGSATAGAALQAWLERIPAELRPRVLHDAAAGLDHDPEPTGQPALPYLRGRQCPQPNPIATPSWPPDAWPLARQARAVMEGICYQGRWMAQAQGDLGASPEHIAVIAGTRLPRLWRQTKTAVSPWPLSWVGAAEPVAAGAALLALGRAGAFGSREQALTSAPTLASETIAAGNDPHRASFREFVRQAGRA